MITWIQTVLQKSHKIVFSILLVVITIAFVFTIGQIPFFGDRHRGGEDAQKDFYGFDLSNQNTLSYLGTFAVYDALLNGVQVSDSFVLKQAYLRHVAGKLGIRGVSQQELLAYIHSAPVFAGKDGKFDSALWKKFVDVRVASGRMSEEALTQILSENAMLAKVESLIAGPGYFFADEVSKSYDNYYGIWNFNLAKIPYDSFKPQIAVSDKALEKFYAERAAAFKVGEGIVVETAFFPLKDFAAVKTPSEAELKSAYEANKAKYLDKNSKQLSFNEARAKVLADVLSDAAMRGAGAKAEALALKVYNSRAKMNSAELKKLLADEKVALKKSKEMRTTDTTLDTSLPQNVAAAGFKLDEQNFYTDPIHTQEGVYIVFLAQKLSAYQPKLADVKADVEKAFKAAEKRRLFAEYGAKLDTAFADGIKAGKTFAEIAKAQKVSFESVKKFTMRDAFEAPDSVKAAYPVVSAELPKMKIGGVSKMQFLGDAGYIVNLVAFEKPKANPEELGKVRANYAKGMSAMTFETVLEDASANAKIR